MKFLILRSASDAKKGGVRQLRGFDIDPGLGQHGGFVLDTFETDHPGEHQIIGEARVVRDGIGHKHLYYTVKATEADAEYLAGIRPNWRHQVLVTEAQLRAEAPEPGPAPMEMVEAEAEAEAALDLDAPERLDYQSLRVRTRILMKAGAPKIRLNSPRPDLERYVAHYEAELTPGPEAMSEAEAMPEDVLVSDEIEAMRELEQRELEP